jgi:hypothetical protein
VLRERLLELGQRAQRLGVYEAFRAALLTIETGLRTDPVGFGDRRFDATFVPMSVYCSLLISIFVTYAVHQQSRIVWVQEYRPYGLGLDQDG